MKIIEKSYGILLHRRVSDTDNSLEFFLIKPNAPGFWGGGKDIWGFPKGRAELGEKPMESAYREFREEVGMSAPEDITYSILEPFTTSRGKVITIYSGDATGYDVEWLGSNLAQAEYPYGSGNIISYCETVMGGWFTENFALSKLDGGYNKMINQVIRVEKMKRMRTLLSI